MKRGLITALALLVAGAAAAQDGPYLFDLLKQPAYRAAWDAMLKGQKVDRWLAGYAKTLDGPATPSTAMTVAGAPAVAAFVCKAQDCGANQFAVLFSASGSRAVGVLAVEGRAPRYLGAPSRAEQAALQQALAN